MSTEFITSGDLMQFKGLMNEELQQGGDLKSRYNLGYYDKVYKEGNYVNIVRKTGYYKIDGSFTTNYEWVDYKNLISIKIPGVDYVTKVIGSITTVEDVWDGGNPKYDYAMSNSTQEEEGSIGVRVVVKSATSIEELKSYISNNPILIQYELNVSNIERFIADTPLCPELYQHWISFSISLLNSNTNYGWRIRAGTSFEFSNYGSASFCISLSSPRKDAFKSLWEIPDGVYAAFVEEVDIEVETQFGYGFTNIMIYGGNVDIGPMMVSDGSNFCIAGKTSTTADNTEVFDDTVSLMPNNYHS